MMQKYALLASASYIPVSPNEVLVKGSALEGFSVLVEDPERRGVITSILQELEDGGRTPEEIVAVLDAEITPEECCKWLESMREGGVLRCLYSEEDNVDRESIWRAFVRYGEIPDPTLLQKLTVVGSGQAECVLEGARALGVSLNVIPLEELDLDSFNPPPSSITLDADNSKLRRNLNPLLYVSFGADRAELYRFNELAVAAGVPVLYARLDGVDYTVGPYVIPGLSACAWEVERSWARASADREQYETLLRHRSLNGNAPISIVGRAGLSTALAVSLLELSLLGFSERAGTIVYGRATVQEISTHSIMRLPRCPVCLPMQPAVRNPLY
ncbi:hypothetical protein KJY78_06300 [Canibacter sp. lx-45]|uniref:hypothetical protein n=1 Tax=Canibacter zhuwentaonis TaxID=2837491 RepID=UPI001BDC49C8|nr:hypothetical protein [Canibacter zhuwentaonis]MBT1035954.1 hypothetical protein [Canibacter zhuwentaonis]